MRSTCKIGDRRRGFSLLELVLVLALSVVLMSMIGAAFSFYATRLDTRDSEVRRVQLAQAILNMLSDDLRGAIHPPEFDDSALSELLAGGAQSGGAESGDSEAGGESADADSLDASLVVEPESLEAVDLSTGTMTTSRPGLLGNQTQLQFDVSRLPRMEEYQPMLEANSIGETNDIPSDIKTVTYYVQPVGGGVTDPLEEAAGTSRSSVPFGAGATNGGLVRRSLDRAVTKWALENGAMTSLLSTGDLLATEVVGLEFQYWDGLQWQMSWDSDAVGCLPPAIQVTLTMAEPAPGGEAAGTESEMVTRVYEHIIRLPMGRPVETTTTSGTLPAAGF